MAEKDLIIKEKVEHTGVFDFSGLYGFAHGWLKYEEYGIVEEEYSEKVSGNAREIIVKWKASKQISDYFKIEDAIKFEVRDMTDVEVEIDGKKKKMNKGKVTIEIKGSLVRDPESGWAGNASLTFFRSVYDKFIIPGRIHDMQVKTEADVKAFKEEIKSFLELSGKR